MHMWINRQMDRQIDKQTRKIYRQIDVQIVISIDVGILYIDKLKLINFNWFYPIRYPFIPIYSK